jgi:hypothetical protein
MLAAMLSSVVSADGDPFWGERLERDPLTGDGTGAGATRRRGRLARDRRSTRVNRCAGSQFGAGR